MTLKVCEIFGSIDGEGVFAGKMATFIRLSGCNLRCRYCDTTYSFDCEQAESLSIDEIVKRVDQIGNYHVTLTGGEPLIHRECLPLVKALTYHGYHVNIETNGSMDISKYILPFVTITMDYKMPSSGEMKKMIDGNVNLLRLEDALKLVVSRNDLPSLKEIIEKLNPKSQIFVSPIFGEIEPVEIVDHIKDIMRGEFQRKFRASLRIQLQLHKIIWDPMRRGV